MDFKVTVTNEIIIKLNEKYYNEEFIEDVRVYWGLDGYDNQEVLTWVAEHIGYSVLRGCDINEIEGVHNNLNAHDVIQEDKDIEVEEIEIR